MKKIDIEFAKQRGWYHIGKIKFYIRHCDFCKNEYNGQGKTYCSYRCSRLAKPIILLGENNPSKRKEFRLKMSERMKGKQPHPNLILGSIKYHTGRFGEKACNWKGGKTSLHSLLKSRIQWSVWRTSVFKRDGYKCLDCGLGGQLEPHHIIPLRVSIEEAFNINNGVTLCRKCHQKTFGKELRLISTYKSLIPIMN